MAAIVAANTLFGCASMARSQSIQWGSPASGSWFNGANWTGGSVPSGPGANALISVAGAYTVSVDGSLNLNSLTLDNPASTLAFTGGPLTSSYVLNTTQAFGLSNGTFVMSSPSGATLTISAAAPISNGGTFRVAGAGGRSVAPLTNRAGGSLQVEANAQFRSLSNQGTVSVADGAAARVRTVSGSGNAYSQIAGALTVAPTATFAVINGGGFDYQGGTVAGTVYLNDPLNPFGAPGTLTVGPAVTGGGTFISTLGSMTIAGNPTPSMNLRVEGPTMGHVTFGGAEPVNRGTLTLRPTSTSGGFVAGGYLRASSPEAKLANEGAIAFDAAPATADVEHTVFVPLENRANGTVTVRGGLRAYQLVTNRGAFTVEASAGTRGFTATAANVGAGAFVQASGTLTVDPSTQFVIANGGTFDYQGGNVQGTVLLNEPNYTSGPSGTLNVGAGVTGGGTFVSTFGSLAIAGNPAPSMNVLVEGVQMGQVTFAGVSPVNRGTLTLRPTSTSTAFVAGGYLSTTAPNATLANEGTVNFERGLATADVEHTLYAPLENRAGGVVNVGGGLRAFQAMTNRGTFTIGASAAGRGVTATSPTAGTAGFTQAAGTLSIDPATRFSLAGGAGFDYLGGAVLGTVHLNDASSTSVGTLTIGPDVTAGGTFVSTRGSMTIMGNPTPSMNLLVEGESMGNIRFTGASPINRGTLTLRPTNESTGFVTGAFLEAPVTGASIANKGTLNFERPPSSDDVEHRLYAPLENHEGATVNVRGGLRSFHSVTNSGSFVVSEGSGRGFVGSGSSGAAAFTQASGTLVIDPAARFGMSNDGRFDYLGGSVQGTVYLNDAFSTSSGTLTIGPAVTGGGTFVSTGGSMTVAGNPTPSMNLLVEGTTMSTTRFTGAAPVNRGTLTFRPTSTSTEHVNGGYLEASTPGAAIANEGTISFERPPASSDVEHRLYATLENRANGTVNVRGGLRSFQTVTNRGTFVVDAGSGQGFVASGSSGPPAFTQAAGRLQVDPDATFEVPNGGVFDYQGGTVSGVVDTTSLTVGAGAGGGTFRTRSTMYLSGDVPAGMHVLHDGPGQRGSTTSLNIPFGLRLNAGATNRGTIEVRASSGGLVYAFGASGLTNAGTLVFHPTIGSDFHNFKGTLTNAPGALVRVEATTVFDSGDVTNYGDVLQSPGASILVNGGTVFRQLGGRLNGTVEVGGGLFIFDGGEGNLTRLRSRGAGWYVAADRTLSTESLGLATILSYVPASKNKTFVQRGATLRVGTGGIDVTTPPENGRSGELYLDRDPVRPARLVLAGDFTHERGGVAAIRSPLPADGTAAAAGVVDLDGGTRTFLTEAAFETRPTSELFIDATVTNGGIRKTGGGTLTLAGNNDFAGGLTVLGGRVNVTAANNMAGGVRVLSRDGLSGTLFVDRDAAFGASGNPVTLAGGTLALAGFAVDHPVTLGLEGDGVDGTIAVVSGQAASLDRPITGSGGLTASGPGTLTLNAVNTYAGRTRVTGGTLAIATGATIGSGDALVEIGPGGTLSLPGAAKRIGALTGSGLVSLNGTPLTLGRPGADSVFSGTVAGSGQIIRAAGDRTTTLEGPVTTTAGGVRVDGGTLRLLNPANSFIGDVRVNAGRLTVVGNGALGDATNNVSLTGGTIQFDGGTFIAPRNVSIDATAGGSIAVRRGGVSAAVVTLTRPLSGSGQLSLVPFLNGEDGEPGGTLAIGGANPDFAGPISLAADGGTMLITGAGSLTGVPSFTVSGRAALSIDETLSDLDRLADAAAVSLDGGALNYLAGSPASEEVAGQLLAAGGSSFLSLGDSGGGTLTFSSLSRPGGRNSGASLTITTQADGATLGVDYRVLFADLPGGMLPSWVTVGTFDAAGVLMTHTAEYRPAYGVVPTGFVPPPPTGGGSAVPEPSTGAALATLAATLAAAGRRRRGSKSVATRVARATASVADGIEAAQFDCGVPNFRLIRHF